MSAFGKILAECAWIAANDADHIARYGELRPSWARQEEKPMTPEVRVEVERLRVLGQRMAYAARREGVVEQGVVALFWGGVDPRPVIEER